MDLATTELLHARRMLYELLARLYLRPPDAALLDSLRSLPGVGEHVPADGDSLEWLQVEYEFVFGRNVYPYESLYVDHDLMLNTAAADRVARLYDACNFTAWVGEAGAPDHLGLELRLMGHLLAIEIAALRDGDQAARAWSCAQQGRCLHAHLTRWAPGCLRAVERVTTHAFYHTVARLTLELVLDDSGRCAAPPPDSIPLEPHRLGPTAAPGHRAAREGEAPIPLRPYPEQPEGEDERGLTWVVRQLITPAEVGIFLSRGDLSAIGRRLGLPVPIDERFQMLRGLFETAGRFELVASLLDALEALLDAEAAGLRAIAASHPAWLDGAQHWLRRVARGRSLLDELRAQTLAAVGEPRR